MAPEKPAAALHIPSATSLRHARCLFHPLRRQRRQGSHTARKPSAANAVNGRGGTLASHRFCSVSASAPHRKHLWHALFREVLAGFPAFACLVAALFFCLLRWRMIHRNSNLNLAALSEDQLPRQAISEGALAPYASQRATWRCARSAETGQPAGSTGTREFALFGQHSDGGVALFHRTAPLVVV